MKNVVYLMLALLLFGLAYYVYWLVGQDNATVMSSRRGGPRPSDLEILIRQWQPYLTLASSLGGIASFFFQVRVWMRGRG